jgi:hypothetical protein
VVFEDARSTPLLAVCLQIFGTFCGVFNESDRAGAKLREDAKSTLRAVPTLEFVTYLSISAACVGAWAYAALTHAPVSATAAAALSFAAGFGPVITAYVMASVAKGPGGSKPQSVASTALQLTAGSAFCAAPVAVACYLALLPPLL